MACLLCLYQGRLLMVRGVPLAWSQCSLLVVVVLCGLCFVRLYAFLVWYVLALSLATLTWTLPGHLANSNALSMYLVRFVSIASCCAIVARKAFSAFVCDVPSHAVDDSCWADVACMLGICKSGLCYTCLDAMSWCWCCGLCIAPPASV
jgi:hypothetical protein